MCKKNYAKNTNNPFSSYLLLSFSSPGGSAGSTYISSTSSLRTEEILGIVSWLEKPTALYSFFPPHNHLKYVWTFVLCSDLRSPSAALMACLFRKVLRSFSWVCLDSRAISSFLCLLIVYRVTILSFITYSMCFKAKLKHQPSSFEKLDNTHSNFPWGRIKKKVNVLLVAP